VLEAIELLEYCHFESTDERCTSTMLWGTALLSLGHLERGVRLLHEAALTAEEQDAYPALRGEIAYSLARGLHAQGQVDEAAIHLRAALRWGTGLTLVRTCLLQIQLHLSEGNYLEALASARQALSRYRSGTERDHALEAEALMHVSSLELLLRSAEELGTHREQKDLLPVRHGTAASVEYLVARSWSYALDGDRSAAFRAARRAADIAPSDPVRVLALAQRALVSTAFSNRDDAREHAAGASELAHTLRWETTSVSERRALLVLAEALADTEPAQAPWPLLQYEALHARNREGTEPSTKLDLRTTASLRYVQGLVRRSSGHAAEARSLLAEARALFDRVGELWRSAMAFIALQEMTGDVFGKTLPLLQADVAFIHHHFPNSFLVDRLRDVLARKDQALTSLPPSRRGILKRLLLGQSPKTIASAKGIGERTVRHGIADIEAAFGVHSIQELIVACYGRGLAAIIFEWAD
jgi:tetratricopeptide (TPR) repeat protein/DNA-binding CsgD family transcriptional regulator